MNTDAMIQELVKKFGNTVTTGQLGQYNRDYLRRARQGELEQLMRGVWNLAPVAAIAVDADDTDSDEVDAEKIKKRFAMLDKLGDGVVAGNVRALIVAGSAGVGKTFTLERKLEQASIDGEIESYESTKGTISAIGLYETLFRNSSAGQVTLLDDADTVWFDDEALNILKAACDSSQKRTISWSKASRYLSDQDIPNRFEYKGQIVFITNLNLDRTVSKGGRLAPHISAMLSRAVFLDLCIHSPKSILTRVEQVLNESSLADDLGLDKKQVKAITTWMNANLNELRSISIRTVNQLASFIKTDPSEWEDMANNTLLKVN